MSNTPDFSNLPSQNPNFPSQNPYASPQISTSAPKPSPASDSKALKEINSARGLLFFVGGLTFVVNLVMLFFLPGQIDEELKKIAEPGMDMQVARNIALAVSFLMQGVAVLLGIVFVVLGFLVRRYPVPVTVTALVLYIMSSIGFGLLDPSTLARGAILKIFIVVVLAKAIGSAQKYKRELATGVQYPS